MSAGRPIALAEPWGAAARAAGGTARLAALLHLTKMSVTRYARGERVPMLAAQWGINGVFERLGVPAPYPPGPRA